MARGYQIWMNQGLDVYIQDVMKTFLVDPNTGKVNINDRLREVAPLFPLVHTEYTQENIEYTFVWLTTMVQFEHEGKLYQRHLVEGGYMQGEYNEQRTFQRLLRTAEKIMLEATPHKNDELVK